MKLCLVLVLLLGGSASGAIEKRILGSTPCNKNRQYHVQIETVKGGKSCGGALLNTQWVITASHCAEQEVKVKLGLNNDVSIFTKAVSFLKGNSKKHEQIIPVSQQFTFIEEEKVHDIMLIKLNEDMSGKTPTMDFHSGACERPPLKEDVQIGGMGAKRKGDKLSDKVNCATTTITECGENDKPPSSYHNDETKTMCAHKPGVDACFGDAGSAVEYKGHLHGIIVSDPKDTCANPIVMLDICQYMAWIEKTMTPLRRSQRPPLIIITLV